MRRGGGVRLPAAVGLVLGGLALVPAGTAAAAGNVCIGVVVDDGTGAAPTVLGAAVAPGTSDLQALSDVGQTPVQNGSGLVCAIAGYPADGLQDCLATSGSLYYYWSFWEGDPDANTWTYASVGPAEHVASAGTDYVEGWRYQDPGPASAAATRPAVTPSAAFAQACPGGASVASSGGGGGGSGSSGSGSTSGSSSTASTTSPGSAAGGVATAPASGSSSGGGDSGTTTPSVTSGTSVTSPSPTAAGTNRTTTTAATKSAHAVPMKSAASSAGHGRSGGGVSVLPTVVVSALVVLMAGLAWFRWRRRPADE